MDSFIFGYSSQNLPIIGTKFKGTASKKHVLIIGGVHGDEVEGVILAKALLSKLNNSPIPELHITIIPQFNIEGILLKTRQNYKGVDLNRNLPTKDWVSNFSKIRYYPGLSKGSENETQALDLFLRKETVNFIISLHSWKPMLNVNGDCSPIANHISKQTGYVIKENIGYPTPGSLGTYTGIERETPTLTYELQKGIDLEEVLKVHLEPLYESLVLYAKKK